jgi:ribonuclease PH
MIRSDGRALNVCRKIKVIKNFTMHPAGSILIQMGDTKVICAATIEEKIPSFLRGQDSGWVTAEYSMLPSSTNSRSPREASRGKLSGRTQEIQRLIGRSLRTVIDLKKLGERTIWLDCDVIQADGGTRCASITGAFMATVLALKKLKKAKVLDELPIKDYIAAISVGIVGDKKMLDLDYSEDSTAEVDLNIVKTGAGEYVEIQGTAEQKPFGDKHLDGLLKLADKGIKELIAIQKKTVG